MQPSNRRSVTASSPVMAAVSEVRERTGVGRVLVTGITGIHGWPVYRHLVSALPEGHCFGIAPPRAKGIDGKTVAAFCITDRKLLTVVRDRFRPALVIHAAGVCDLDVCEARPHWAERINRDGTAAVGEVFGATTPIVFLSTDLVFSGNSPPAGGYAEHHTPDPVSIAGKTFFAAEQELTDVARCTIIRLGLPVGASITGDKGGLDWIEGRLRKTRPVTLFHDEYRSVISCTDLARCVYEFICRREDGLFHLGGPVPVSLHGLGRMIVAGGGYRPDLLRGISRFEEENGPPRIGNVALDSSRILKYLSAPPAAWNYTELDT